MSVFDDKIASFDITAKTSYKIQDFSRYIKYDSRIFYFDVQKYYKGYFYVTLIIYLLQYIWKYYCQIIYIIHVKQNIV